MIINPVDLHRKAMVEAIRPFGFRVLEASSVVQAQHQVKRHPGVRLLIVDLSALELDEVQTALWFHGMYPQMKVLVASSWIYTLNSQLSESEQIAFCPKPFTALQLAQTVRRTLDCHG
jgi:DNA-binding NtrC family response regulator